MKLNQKCNSSAKNSDGSCSTGSSNNQGSSTSNKPAGCGCGSANEKEIYFTSGGTEGNNLAIFGAAYKNRRKGNRVITTAVEHPSVQNSDKPPDNLRDFA